MRADTGLRDQFAGLALTGMLSYSLTNAMTGNWVENSNCEGVAKDAYAFADAMMQARHPKVDGILAKPVIELWRGRKKEPGSQLVTRARNMFRRLKVETVSDLVSLYSLDLTSEKNVGVTLLTEVREVLASHGLALAGESVEDSTTPQKEQPE